MMKVYISTQETHGKFKFVLQTLGNAACQLNYYYGSIPSLSIEDQFLATLIKLRTHRTNFEQSLFFGISEKQISNIVIT